MIITLKSTADASLYECLPNLNTGLDEILEVGKLAFGVGSLLPQCQNSSVSSILQFDLSTHPTWNPTAKLFLNLKLANAKELPRNQRLVAYAYTASWDEGTGYYIQQPINSQNGIVWNDISSSMVNFRQFPVLGTTSMSSFPIQDQDARIEITNFEFMVSSSMLRGILLALPQEDVDNTANTSNIKFFSSQTHTIYEPTLTVEWDSQVYNTGSLVPLPTGEIQISYQNLKERYVYGSKENIKIIVRDKYPLHNFNTKTRYDGRYYLPQTSYFRVVDVASGTPINIFSDAAKISCDNNIHNFTLDTTSLYKGRYYRIEFRIEKSNGEVLLFSPLETFVVK